MDGNTALARRYYHHIVHGGTLTPENVSAMVCSMENKDAEIERLRKLNMLLVGDKINLRAELAAFTGQEAS